MNKYYHIFYMAKQNITVRKMLVSEDWNTAPDPHRNKRRTTPVCECLLLLNFDCHRNSRVGTCTTL